MLEQIGKISPKDVDGYLKMLKEANAIFELGYQKLAGHPFHKIMTMIKYAPAIIKMRGYESVYTFVSRYLKHPNLRQAFSIQPLLVGGNPFQTSSIYALIHSLEQKWGIYFCMGGTGKLVQELEKLMLRQDIKIKYKHDIEHLSTKNNEISELHFTNGLSQKFDLVISNADPIQVSTELIGKKKISLHNTFVNKSS